MQVMPVANSIPEMLRENIPRTEIGPRASIRLFDPGRHLHVLIGIDNRYRYCELIIGLPARMNDLSDGFLRHPHCKSRFDKFWVLISEHDGI